MMSESEKKISRRRILLAISSYSVCSSLLLLINKLTVHYLPSPTFVTLVQIVMTLVVVQCLAFTRVIEVDAFEWGKAKSFLLYTVAFGLGLLFNMKALEVSNVETVIIFRSCAPLVVSILDWLFLGRRLPSAKSWAALAVIALGAAGYVFNDAQFLLSGVSSYGYTLLYLLVLCFQMTYGKRLLSRTRMNTLWGPVYYSNLLSIIPVSMFWVISDEPRIMMLVFDMHNVCLLITSCLFCVWISYAGWDCRRVMSAASYTLVGVMNKVGTIILNVLLWDKHASHAGLASLFLSLIGGYLYEQAPLRNSAEHAQRSLDATKLSKKASDV